MRKTLKLIAIVLIIIMSLSFMIGCGSVKIPNKNKEEDEVIIPAKRPTVAGQAYGAGRKLTINLWGETPSGLDEVIEEYKKRTKDEFAFDLEFKFKPLDTYKNELTLNIGSSSSNLDLVFDAQWVYLNEWSKNGNYIRLDKYFNNSEYPGLQKAFAKDYINNNKFNKGVYGIPLTETFGSTNVTYYRED